MPLPLSPVNGQQGVSKGSLCRWAKAVGFQVQVQAGSATVKRPAKSRLSLAVKLDDASCSVHVDGQPVKAPCQLPEIRDEASEPSA